MQSVIAQAHWLTNEVPGEDTDPLRSVRDFLNLNCKNHKSYLYMLSCYRRKQACTNFSAASACTAVQWGWSGSAVLSVLCVETNRQKPIAMSRKIFRWKKKQKKLTISSVVEVIWSCVFPLNLYFPPSSYQTPAKNLPVVVPFEARWTRIHAWTDVHARLWVCFFFVTGM